MTPVDHVLVDWNLIRAGLVDTILMGWNLAVENWKEELPLYPKQEWYNMDGDHFDYEKFFTTIYDLFDKRNGGRRLLVCGTIASSKPTADASMSGPSHVEQLKAALTTKKCSAAAAPAATTSV
ncbi:hypothetical protein B0H10DRAFT_1970376 [Mycena sp. CBHHK59/15]|nr:hypothetical protein B0H10DRAFT_1970376 [Mycena sp. CBHHK59/15]